MFNPGGSTSGGVARHALDFRVLTDSRVALLDASEPLFRGVPKLQQQEAQSRAQDLVVGFRPIPGLSRAIADAVAAGRGRGTVAGVDIGIVCGAADVVVVGEALWAGIARGIGLGGGVVVKMEEA
jgi:mediator of RNA polymerase II transcription subunit 14